MATTPTTPTSVESGWTRGDQCGMSGFWTMMMLTGMIFYVSTDRLSVGGDSGV